ncbi:MAG: rhamnulokinase [Planctomycetaceae bacterium]|nr:rhamnulokinase [Planctomycetaceae bacterium]
MSHRCYIAVDLGAESGRVIAGLYDGQRIRLEPVHRFPNGAVSIAGTLRWDLLRLWAEIQDGLTQAATSFGEWIGSIGVDTWGVDYVLLSKTGEMLGQPYMYRDPRSHGMLAAALAQVPRKDIFAATGLQFMEINTLYQLLSQSRSNPELLGLADKFLMIPDFFHWCLSGSRVVEFTNATTTQFFSPEGKWAYGLLDKLQIPTHFLPEVVLPGTKLGTLREDVARRCGMRRVEIVAPATHDTGSAVAAIPTAHTGTPNWAYISSGTWSLMGVEVGKAVLTDKALEYNVTNEGGIDGTYRLLKNIMGLWLVQECRRSFEKRGKPMDYARLTHLAEEAKPFLAFVDPDDGAFLAPSDMPAALREWCHRSGQSVPDDEGGLVRCCLESLALKYRVVLGRLEQLTGTKVEVIHIVGGGSQNDVLNQFTANATGRPVIAGPVEATAIGNVLVQARGAGEIASLAELRDVVRRSYGLKTFEPAHRAAWEEAYGRFTRLCKLPND